MALALRLALIIIDAQWWLQRRPLHSLYLHRLLLLLQLLSVVLVVSLNTERAGILFLGQLLRLQATVQIILHLKHFLLLVHPDRCQLLDTNRLLVNVCHLQSLAFTSSAFAIRMVVVLNRLGGAPWDIPTFLKPLLRIFHHHGRYSLVIEVAL